MADNVMIRMSADKQEAATKSNESYYLQIDLPRTKTNTV